METFLPAPLLRPAAWVQVLVDAPARERTYTYRLADGMTAAGGDVVCVPFGSQLVGGIVLDCLDQLPAGLDPGRLKTVESVVGTGLFAAGFWPLLVRVADYYLVPLARVLETALPPGILSRARRRVRLVADAAPMAQWGLSAAAKSAFDFLRSQAHADFSWRFCVQRLSGGASSLRELQARGLIESYYVFGETARPRTQQFVVLAGANADLCGRSAAVVQCLRRLGGEVSVEQLLAEARTTRALLQKLHAGGHVRIYERQILRLAAPTASADAPKPLTDAQKRVLERLQGATPGPVLLEGVTGSGKTEVYLQAIAPVLARGESALVLVPEIGLTPQLTDRFAARFGARVRVYHSALSEGERFDCWRQMLTGEAQVVVGTRSAVFAPLPKLGLIVLDEEHDGSYKQDRPAPCYHARTVALWRGELAGCPVLLGSATPDLESFDRATAGRYLHLEMPERVAGRPLPAVEVVDMREELHRGNFSPFSATLQRAVAQMQAAGRQGILFINRRGYSTFVLCRNCGETLRCPHCAVSLTYHRLEAGDYLRCHYCNYGAPQPRACPHCTSPNLRYFGAGTQRIAAQLGEQFPTLRVLRFDRDTTARKDAHRQILEQFGRGEADILVGTQMLTKGLDLPQVTLVGILAADGLLNLPDFRASERAFQLLTQVAGRAGRGSEPGRVILQTYAPEHPVVAAASTHDFRRYAAAELTQRQALGYPPFVQLVALQLSAAEQDSVIEAAEALARRLDGSADFEGRLLGPAPCTVERVAGRYRWQLLIKNLNGEAGRASLRALLAQFMPCAGVTVAVDVDPLRLL
ncbi:primosomal protein N' [Gloeobacter morelensis]|uniref:Replication restart protein PriA n=1 Tax=Gloeobacter morelensis MG652769 TaxID=2781736 RepID=A0ABY3PTI1_9CYAN|nr:primosomal protein N' [Gloeobacter morelensis]UFP96817.1 primosomal protein N' [Gloeobacter morelensis MG652769]